MTALDTLTHVLWAAFAVVLMAGFIWVVGMLALEAARTWWLALRLRQSQDHAARLSERTLRSAFRQPADSDSDSDSASTDTPGPDPDPGNRPPAA